MTTLPIATDKVTQEVQIRMGKEGRAAAEPRTVMENFNAVVARAGDHPALFQKRPALVRMEYTFSFHKILSFSHRRFRTNPLVKWTGPPGPGRNIASKSITSGKRFYRSVSIASTLSILLDSIAPSGSLPTSEPSPPVESVLVRACVFYRQCVCVLTFLIFSALGIYTTNGPDACKYISEHSKAKVVVCEGVKQLEKYYEISKKLPHLKALVMYGPEELPADIKSKCKIPCYTFESFLELGSKVSDEDLKERTNAWKPGETCTLIYTSGTTGPPKAVMITNDNVTWTTDTMLHCTRRELGEDDVMISYLPLSHIAAQMLDMHVPMRKGLQMYFAQPDALKGSLGATLKEVRPTIFFGVPRVWEKIYDKLQEVGKSTTGVKKILSTWAKGEAGTYWDSYDFDALKEFSFTRTLPVGYYASSVLLSAVHKALGLDRCHSFYVSSAPIDVKILKYFHSLNIPIMELFGQSECTGPHTVNTYTAFKLGSVGRPMLGTETKIAEGNGELCYRGRHIFAGYMGMPEKTEEAIDSDGWLHSGDVAKFDDNDDPRIPKPSGFMYITGRIKELIITAGGENVPPVLIEDELKRAMPALSNAMVIGDKRKFLTVLLCLKVEVDADNIPTNKLTGTALEVSKEIKSSATTTLEAMNDEKWQRYFDEGVKAANEKATSRAQRVGKWALLPTDFSEKGGELTPTLKLKRPVAAEKYSKEIEALYS